MAAISSAAVQECVRMASPRRLLQPALTLRCKRPVAGEFAALDHFGEIFDLTPGDRRHIEGNSRHCAGWVAR
jgi:hypothetical protein